MRRSVQETHAPSNACFGCGPSNPKGLRIRSFVEGEGLVCDWTPEPHHEAFPGVLNGGIVGSILDCHANWTACMHLMQRDGLEAPPCTVTAQYSVTMRRPTPTDGPVHLVSRVVASDGPKVEVAVELTAKGKVCATCTGTFVAVEPGHPAYHRW